MAGFEGITWSDLQMRYSLKEKRFEVQPHDARVYAVTRSLHYGLCLAFEGIRFACRRSAHGDLEIVFANLSNNLRRFRQGIAFNLGRAQQSLVPTEDTLRELLIETFFADARLRPFLEHMADLKKQGYLRPFTVDEDLSIGVTFPANPCIRAVICSYDRYLGEPFRGVVIPHLVRAVGANGTGCLKLGINYLTSVKAVDAAKALDDGAAAALFLDDQLHLPLRDRKITEWDSSCCLLAFTDGTVVRIPDNPLILPSVTIRGIVALLREQGVRIEERDVTYGELIDRSRAHEVVALCSVGTAGILNRCQELRLVDERGAELGRQVCQPDHPLYETLGAMRSRYWELFLGTVEAPPGITLSRFPIGSAAESVRG